MKSDPCKRILTLTFLLLALTGTATPILLENGWMNLKFDPQTGALEEIETKAGTRLKPLPINQYNIQTKDGKWIFPPEENSFKLEKHKITTSDKGQELVMELSCPGWKLDVSCRLFPGEPVFSRKVAWTRLDDTPISTSLFRFSLDGLVIGKAADCTVVHPGHWPPRNSSLSGEKRRQYSALSRNHMPGAVLYNERFRCGVGVTMQTVKSDYSINSETGDDTVSFQTDFNVRAVMKKGDRVDSGEELVSVFENSSLNNAFASLGHAWTLNGFSCKKRPTWTDGAVLYSGYVQGSTWSRWVDVGGFENFRKVMLPHLKNIGVDILWFNPFNDGRYGVYSYYDFEDGVGTEKELHTLCSDAHELGIRVLMDLIPHGPKPGHPYGEKVLKEHPDWISRNADGSPKLWWGGYSMDYASPGWQNEMEILATYYIDRCGINGWRVDCARYSPDNDRPTGGRIPSQSGTEGAVTLMKRVHEAMDGKKPECILLGETRTTSHLSQMEYIYDTTLGGEVFPVLSQRTPEDWVPQLKLFLDRDEAAMPFEYASGLMRFCENHDTATAIRRYGTGPRDALLATCFLIPGLPLINQDGDIGAGIMLRKLSAIRKRPEFVRGNAVYLATGSSDPAVLTFTRILPEQFSAVAINFTGQKKRVELVLPPECRGKELPFRELCEDAQAVRDGNVIRFELPPYATRVFAFAPVRPVSLPAPDGQPVAKITEPAGTVRLENAFWKAEFQDGFPVSLCDQNGRDILDKMQFVSSAVAIRDGKKFDFATNIASLRHTRTRNGKDDILVFDGSWKNGATFRSIYTLGESPELRVRLEFHLAAESERPALELTFGKDVDEWYVATLEGALRDVPSTSHPRGDEFALIEKDIWLRHIRISHLLQKSGVLWQADAQPLDPSIAQVDIRKGTSWTGIRFTPEDLSRLDDLFLRENGSLAQGLTLRLQPKNNAVEFALRANDPPQTVPGITSGSGWELKTDGSLHRFTNSHFELRLNRNEGGGIHALFSKSGSPLLWDTIIYSNDGFFTPSFDPEHSRELPCCGTSKSNLESAMTLTKNTDSLTLRFGGELKRHDSPIGVSALPKVAYTVDYRLDASNRIGFHASVTPRPRPELEGSLVWECLLPGDIVEIEVETLSGVKTFRVSQQKKDERFWSSAELPLAADGSITFVRRDGKQRWSIEKIDRKEIKSLSLFCDKRGNTCFRAAFFDAEGCKETTVRTFSCDLVVK